MTRIAIAIITTIFFSGPLFAESLTAGFTSEFTTSTAGKSFVTEEYAKKDESSPHRVGDKRWNGLAWEYWVPGYWKRNPFGDYIWVRPRWSTAFVPEVIWQKGSRSIGRSTHRPGYWQRVRYADYNYVKSRNPITGSKGYLQRHIEFRDPRVYVF